MKHTKEEREDAVRKLKGTKLRIETQLLPTEKADKMIIEGEVHAEGTAGAIVFLLLNAMQKLEEQNGSVRPFLVLACKQYIKED